MITIYDNKFADVYDDIYRCHLDYPRLAAQIRELAVKYCPHANTLLDVACGTAEHLWHLRAHFDVTGIDLSEPMLANARRKVPDVALHHGDMRDFDLDAEFDVITCMYASVAYLDTLGDLFAAVGTMAGHLAPKGVLIVEPWVLREDWNGGEFVHATFQAPQRTVTRMGQWITRGNRSHVEMHYLVGESSGVRHFVDEQTLTLFSRQEYEDAFTTAGCEVRFLPDTYAGRPVFVATRGSQ